jgi:GNAT superfamily N-acetyltransferase
MAPGQARRDTIRLEPVSGALPAGLDNLRAEARAEGHTMLDTLAADWATGKTRFDRRGEALFAAYLGADLAGMGGLTLDPTAPAALRMRRFYVSARFRRRGVGQALAAALLERAGQVRVVANAAAGSEPFWEALGFEPDRRDGHTHILTGATPSGRRPRSHPLAGERLG